MISLSLNIRLCDSFVGSIFRTKILDSHASFFVLVVVIDLKVLKIIKMGANDPHSVLN